MQRGNTTKCTSSISYIVESNIDTVNISPLGPFKVIGATLNKASTLFR